MKENRWILIQRSKKSSEESSSFTQVTNRSFGADLARLLRPTCRPLPPPPRAAVAPAPALAQPPSSTAPAPAQPPSSTALALLSLFDFHQFVWLLALSTPICLCFYI